MSEPKSFVKIMVLSPVQITENSQIYFEHPKGVWSQGLIRLVDKSFKSVFGEKLESDLLFTLCLDKFTSSAVLASLSSHF